MATITDRVFTVSTSGKWYATIWRWHFFAGLSVLPLLLLLSLTGSIYVFKPQIQNTLYGDLYTVTPAATEAISYQRQAAVVQASLPDYGIGAIVLPEQTGQSTQFNLRNRATGDSRTAFVNPYNGDYLGSLGPRQDIVQLARDIHGSLLLGNRGSMLVELGASWAILMIVSGLYLWWQRSRRDQRIHAFRPRIRQGGKVFLRDLHASIGVYLSLFILLFLLSGLPWTFFWGNYYLGSLQQVSGQERPWAAGFRFSYESEPAAGRETMDWDQAVAVVERHDFPGRITLTGPRNPSDTFHVRTFTGNTATENWLHFDQYSGRIVEQADFSDFPPIAKATSLGVDLHEGTLFGLPNQLACLLIALLLMVLTVTGALMWWQRRPRGALAAPPGRLPEQFGIAVPLTLLLLCLLLPLLAVSLIFILLLDRLLGPLLARRSATA